MATADPSEVKSDVEVNIGLVGEIGSGKSSFFNAVVRNNTNELAETGGIITTSERKCYPHPSKPNIKLWDLPGLGSASYPDITTYYKTLKLASQYDAFLLFISPKSTVDNKRLAIRLESTRKPFLFIRTFIDIDIENERKNKPNTFNEAKIMDEIRQNTLTDLNDLDSVSGEKIFLISNVKLEKWDFDRLNNQILYELPTRNAGPSCQTELLADFKLAKLTFAERQKNEKIDKKTFLKSVKAQHPKEQRAIQDNGIEAVQKLMKAKLDEWKEIKISLAIVGLTGAGKSSFINAIRGMKDDDKNAAPTGVIDTTKVPIKYCYEDNENITLFDCPGVGSVKFPDLKSFCEEVDIAEYDGFILMNACRFHDCSANLAMKLRSINKPFFCVRTKIDQDYANEKRKKKFNEVAMLENIKAECSQSLKLKNATLDNKDIFLISNRCPIKWDFARLILAIGNRLPPRKRECFLFSMLDLSEDILEKKVEKLKGRVKYVAFFFSIIVKPFTAEKRSLEKDFNLIVEKVEFYRSQLGLPNAKFDEFEMIDEVLKKKVRRFHLTSKNVNDWLEKFNTKNVDEDTKCDDEDTEHDDEDTESGKEKEKSLLWSHMKKAKNPRYKFVYRSLRNLLDEMKEVGKEILQDTVARSKPDIDIEY